MSIFSQEGRMSGKPETVSSTPSERHAAPMLTPVGRDAARTAVTARIGALGYKSPLEFGAIFH